MLTPDPKYPELRRRRFRPIPVRMLVPNMITLLAICAGLTAIRLSIEGRMELAVAAIVFAAVLDGVDGRVARMIKGQSKFGAELDSLADFVNFGVAPGLILYFWGLHDLKSAGWIDPKAVTLILLGCGVIIALVATYAWLRAPALSGVDEGSRLANAIGWAMVLPQMLASLGVIFAAAGVGGTIGALVSAIIPNGSVFLAVILYALGMVVFTMIMGNAFAAFPVMAAAIGIPILIHGDGGNPAVIGAVGMLSGFCGTLMTPMAANFNIVPAALLELKSQYAVVRAQVPTAIAMLIANIAILYVAGFHL